MDGLSHQRRSSCLLFQMFGVEIYSFLPDDQRDRGNLPGQGETSHRRLRPLGQQSLVESVERSSGDAGHGGCTLEDFLEIVVMILIQSKGAGERETGSARIRTRERTGDALRMPTSLRWSAKRIAGRKRRARSPDYGTNGGGGKGRGRDRDL